MKALLEQLIKSFSGEAAEALVHDLPSGVTQRSADGVLLYHQANKGVKAELERLTEKARGAEAQEAGLAVDVQLMRMEVAAKQACILQSYKWWIKTNVQQVGKFMQARAESCSLLVPTGWATLGRPLRLRGCSMHAQTHRSSVTILLAAPLAGSSGGVEKQGAGRQAEAG